MLAESQTTTATFLGLAAAEPLDIHVCSDPEYIVLVAYTNVTPDIKEQSAPFQITITQLPGDPPRYEVRCPRLSDVEFTLAVTKDGMTYEVTVSMATNGGVIVWPKSEGPKYTFY